MCAWGVDPFSLVKFMWASIEEVWSIIGVYKRLTPWGSFIIRVNYK